MGLVNTKSIDKGKAMSKNNTTLNFVCGFAIFYVVVLLILVALGKFPKIILIGYGIASIASFIMYYDDKDRAKKGKRRIPEINLFGVDMWGGWIGASFAQKLFNHKTTKTSFRVFYYGAIISNIIWTILFYRIYPDLI